MIDLLLPFLSGQIIIRKSLLFLADRNIDIPIGIWYKTNKERRDLYDTNCQYFQVVQILLILLLLQFWLHLLQFFAIHHIFHLLKVCCEVQLLYLQILLKIYLPFEV